MKAILVVDFDEDVLNEDGYAVADINVINKNQEVVWKGIKMFKKMPKKKVIDENEEIPLKMWDLGYNACLERIE